MKNLYRETVGLCPICASDSAAWYEEEGKCIDLIVKCAEHGLFRETVERDSRFFRTRYEEEYERSVGHLVLPVTYECNLKCTYCYTLSNSLSVVPEDRPAEKILSFIRVFNGNVTLIGGEPTLREDLAGLIRSAKEMDAGRKVSVGTNGQKLTDIRYLRELRDSGLDFVFLSLNDLTYDRSRVIHQNKVEALRNCFNLGMPVWLQRTIDDLSQLDSLGEVLRTYRKVIFNVTLRSVKPFGTFYPSKRIFVSDILGHLKKDTEVTKGSNPFNCYIRLEGKRVKVCSWVNDMKRLDPIDSNYVISNDALTTFHRGMKVDEMLLMNRMSLSKDGSPAENIRVFS